MKTALLPWLGTLALAAAAVAQSTTFTYQGRLTNAGQPAAGLHDIRFRLFDAPAAGTQVGATLCLNNVDVEAGLFTVSLDFGPQFSTPSPRFIEVEVRADTGLNCPNNTGFTRLTPRQPLTRAPLASHADAAFALDAADGSPTGAVLVDDDGRLGINTPLPLSRLHVTSGSVGDGIRITGSVANDPAYHLYEGATPRAALGLALGPGNWSADAAAGDVVLRTDRKLLLQNGSVRSGLAIAGNNVGIGTAAPTAQLHVDSASLDTKITETGSFQERDALTRLTYSGLSSTPGVTLIGVNKPGQFIVRAGVQWNAASDRGEVFGDVKNFRTPNPLDPRTDICYACIEGPEAAMYTRGTARLSAGRATLVLPDHFRAMAVENSLTVILTPRSFSSRGLAYERANGQIIVGELHQGRGNYEFDWEVKAVRKGYEDYQVLRPWNELLPADADPEKAWQNRLSTSR